MIADLKAAVALGVVASAPLAARGDDVLHCAETVIATAYDGPAIRQATIATGLAHPWDMAFLSATEALVTEKDGGIKRVALRTGAITAVDGVPADLDNVRRDDPRDNSGLFGVALDPRFQDNGWIYIAYSAGDAAGTALRVIRAKLSDDNRLHAIEEVFRAGPPSPVRFHYGGGLAFGADGALYVTVGDRIFHERNQAPVPAAQDPSDSRGQIYRLNPDGTIPADNPDFGEGAVPGLYAVGIRASQGITVDPATGDIWFSEHGSVRGDEINILQAGANYGWPIETSGDYRDDDYAPPAITDATFTPPACSWDNTVAPTGLTFYAGERIPGWRGDLIVGGLSSGSLWRLRRDGRNVIAAQRVFPETPARLRNVKQAPDGRLYLLTDEPEGRIIRVELDR